MFHPYLLQLEGQVVALLVQNMERLDETVKEEADGVHNTLGKHHSLVYLTCDIVLQCLDIYLNAII